MSLKENDLYMEERNVHAEQALVDALRQREFMTLEFMAAALKDELDYDELHELAEYLTGSACVYKPNK